MLSWIIGAFFGYTIYAHMYLKEGLEEEGKTLFTVGDLLHYPV
jgi:hypothetical protein